MLFRSQTGSQTRRRRAHRAQVNHDFVETYGAPDFAVTDMHDYGPSLGPVGRQRTDDFVKQCSGNASLRADSIRKIRSAMNCAVCHNEDGVGAINYLQAVYNKGDVTGEFPTRA